VLTNEAPIFDAVTQESVLIPFLGLLELAFDRQPRTFRQVLQTPRICTSRLWLTSICTKCSAKTSCLHSYEVRTTKVLLPKLATGTIRSADTVLPRNFDEYVMGVLNNAVYMSSANILALVTGSQMSSLVNL
jgi:hypothetical protein